MATPQSLVRDVLLILPSIKPDSVELIAARADGPVLTERTGRHDRKLASHTRRLWQFFKQDDRGFRAGRVARAHRVLVARRTWRCDDEGGSR